MEDELKTTHETDSEWAVCLDSLRVINSYLLNMRLDTPTLSPCNMEEWRKWLDSIGKLPLFDYNHIDIKPFLPEMQRTSDWAQRIIDAIPERPTFCLIGERTHFRRFLTGTPTEDFEQSLKSVVKSCRRISEILDPSKSPESTESPSRPAEDEPPQSNQEAETPQADNIPPPPVVPPPNFIDTPSDFVARPSEPQQEESPLAQGLRNYSRAVTNIVLNIAAGATVNLHFEGNPDVEIKGPVTAQLTAVEGRLRRHAEEGRQGEPLSSRNVKLQQHSWCPRTQ